MTTLRALVNAKECCATCGERWGVLRPGEHTYWQGVCPICGQDAALSSTRTWGYLRRGVEEMMSNLRIP